MTFKWVDRLTLLFNETAVKDLSDLVKSLLIDRKIKIIWELEFNFNMWLLFSPKILEFLCCCDNLDVRPRLRDPQHGTRSHILDTEWHQILFVLHQFGIGRRIYHTLMIIARHSSVFFSLDSDLWRWKNRKNYGLLDRILLTQALRTSYITCHAIRCISQQAVKFMILFF